MFWFLFFLSLVMFVQTKFRQGAFVILPHDIYPDDYLRFYVVFGLVLGIKLVLLIYSIVKQSMMQVFLIDWEKPRQITKSNQQSQKL